MSSLIAVDAQRPPTHLANRDSSFHWRTMKAQGISSILLLLPGLTSAAGPTCYWRGQKAPSGYPVSRRTAKHIVAGIPRPVMWG
ncbi:hypothetical protein F4808DRAFT_438923 [Astrocystis sublimbata]|nr:hypothetical protein F4808DRAFT_438923 [Astrocystis sublimbata]